MRIAPTSKSPTAQPPRDLIVGEPGSPVGEQRRSPLRPVQGDPPQRLRRGVRAGQDHDRDDQGVPGRQWRPGRGSARVRDEVTKLTDAVVVALLKRKPDGGAIHIEEIQDQVELALMRGGEHEVARAYVLYREKRTQERAQEKQKKSAQDRGHDAARARQRRAQAARLRAPHRRWSRSPARALPDAEPNRILKATLKDLYDGVPMEEVRKCVVLAARTLIEKDPAYSYVTARLLLDALRFEALGEEATQARHGDEVRRVLPALRQARHQGRPAERGARAVRPGEARRRARSRSATCSSATSACRRSTTATSSSTSTSAGAASSCRSASSCASRWGSR